MTIVVLGALTVLVTATGVLQSNPGLLGARNPVKAISAPRAVEPGVRKSEEAERDVPLRARLSESAD